MAEPTYTMLEIAAGTGMLGHAVSIACEAIGIRVDTECGCEWESCAAAAFMAGVEIETGRRPAVWDDATSFVGRRYRCGGTGSGVDIIAAGYPCPPFSCAGRRAGGKDARHLWPAVRRIVARLKPSVVFFENVDGHVTLGLWKVLRDCERLGYRTTCGVFSAEEVGAPHLRKRVFILGLAGGSEQGRIDQQGARADRGSAAGRTGEAVAADFATDDDWLDNILSCGGTRPIEPDMQRWDGWASGQERVQAHPSNKRAVPDAQPFDSAVGDAERAEPRPGNVGEQGGDARGDNGNRRTDAGGELAQRPSGGRGAGRQSPERDGQPQRRDEQLANGIGAGQQRHQSAPCQPGNTGPTPECGGDVDRPLFPPGRTDYRRWAELAAGGLDPSLLPAIESGVSVVADGMASASDLLRLGGNGVVPATAAWAFLNLLACLMDPVATANAEPGLFDGTVDE